MSSLFSTGIQQWTFDFFSCCLSQSRGYKWTVWKKTLLSAGDHQADCFYVLLEWNSYLTLVFQWRSSFFPLHFKETDWFKQFRNLFHFPTWQNTRKTFWLFSRRNFSRSCFSDFLSNSTQVKHQSQAVNHKEHCCTLIIKLNYHFVSLHCLHAHVSYFPLLDLSKPNEYASILLKTFWGSGYHFTHQLKKYVFLISGINSPAPCVHLIHTCHQFLFQNSYLHFSGSGTGWWHSH